MTPIGRTLHDRFRIEAKIGDGSTGTVYRATDLSNKRACAVRIFSEDLRKYPPYLASLEREIARQLSLSHENIGTVWALDTTEDGCNYMAAELIEGQRLDKLMRARGPLAFAQAMPLIKRIACALTYAHKRDLVHSDLRVRKCYLTGDGVVKIVDFGLVRALTEPTTREGAGDISASRETMAHRSFEALRGQAASPADDIYALACVTYEMLAGRHPFHRKDARYAFQMQLDLPVVSGLSHRQWLGLRRGLAFLREERSESIAEFVSDLEFGVGLWARLARAMNVRKYVSARRKAAQYLADEERKFKSGEFDPGKLD